MKKDNKVYLYHILDHIHFVEEILAHVTFEKFIGDKEKQFAVIRCFELMGEAVNKLDINFRNKYPEIEWKSVSGFRDVLIHDYEGLNQRIIWETAQERLPILKNQLLKILQGEK